MTDPAQLIAAIDADCRALDAAAKELGAKIKALADAEIAYGDAMDGALVALQEEYDGKGERMPGERQREALAHGRMDSQLRGRFLRLKRDVEALQAYGRMKEKTLSGRQSELSFLKAEGQGPTAQPQWSRAAA